MTEQQVLKLLTDEGAIREGHFVLTSGSSPDQRQHAQVYANLRNLSETAHGLLCLAIAERFKNQRIGAVIGPADAGNRWAFGVARCLIVASDRSALHVRTEKMQGEFAIHGKDRVSLAGQRILTVDDVLTTGASLRSAIKEAAYWGVPAGAAVVLNRGPLSAPDLGVESFSALARLPLESWVSEDCPLCKRGVPINTDVGHGNEFLAERGRVP